MTTVKKRRSPANAPHSHSAQRESCEVLPCSYWRGERKAALAAFGIFALIFVAFVAIPHSTPSKEKVSVAEPQAKQLEPFDIMLSTPEPALRDDVPMVAAKPSLKGKIQKPTLHQKEALPVPKKEASHILKKEASPVLKAKVTDNSVNKDDAQDKEDQALHQAEAAQNSMRSGDIKQAIEFQHRAVEQDPSNMLYRLNLGIMHDRAADNSGAVTLYRQVIEAYAKHDKTLPPKVNIDDVRQRLDYLATKDPQ